MGDYVGDATQYPKWHVNRFRGVTPTKGWNVNGLCFFVCSLAQLGAKTLDQFWQIISQNTCFCESCISLELEQRYHNFRGSESPKMANNRPDSQNAKIIQWQYLQNSKFNQVETWSSTGYHELLIQKYKMRSQGSVAWVTWPTFKCWDPQYLWNGWRYKPQILHADWQ